MTIGRIPSVEGGIQPTIFDAKADILTATAADTPAILAVGANNTVLTADSSTATGLKWATAAAPSYAFTSYTPTYVNFTLGNGTMSAEYAQIDKVVYVKGLLTLGSTSSVTGQIRISMPVNAASGDMGVGYSPAFDIYAFDNGVGVWLLYGNLVNSSGTTTLSLSAQNASGTYLQTTAVTSAIPFTWGSTDTIHFTAIYKAA